MENASEALLIAGGILIVILILSMFVVMYNKVSNNQQNMQIQEDIKRTEEFNKEWYSYDKKLLYGAEVLTVINKAENNNNKYEAELGEEYYVEVKVINKDKTFVENNKNKIFKCEKMTKNANTGKINYIEFKIIE